MRPNPRLDYPATLRSRSLNGMQQQAVLAIRAVILAIEKRRLNRKQ
jgi:hypothetical protein